MSFHKARKAVLMMQARAGLNQHLARQPRPRQLKPLPGLRKRHAMGDHEAQLILMGLHEFNDLQPAALRRAIGAAQLLMTSHQGRQIQRHGRGMNAGNHQHAVGLERTQGRRQHGRRPGGFDHHIKVSFLRIHGKGFVDVLPLEVQQILEPHGAQDLQPRGIAMAGNHHLGRPCGTRKQRNALADIAGPQDQHAIAGLDIARAHGFEAHRQRLGQCSNLGVHAVRNRHAIAQGHGHILGKAAMAHDTDAATGGAGIEVAGTAAGASAAGDRRPHGHQLAQGQMLGPLASGHDLAAELVAHGHRQRGLQK
jgi:hypothetical protein